MIEEYQLALSDVEKMARASKHLAVEHALVKALTEILDRIDLLELGAIQGPETSDTTDDVSE